MILLDTNVLLWFFAGNERLSTNVRQAIEDDPGEYFVSTISFWEIAIKRQIGKLSADLDIPQAVNDAGFITLNMTTQHVYAYELLPLLHRDPFDRMLVAQSKVEHIALLTGGTKLKGYEIRIIDAFR